jgi:hypothetical protein
MKLKATEIKIHLAWKEDLSFAFHDGVSADNGIFAGR